uniref:Uncharacterized protein n=1 Tax=Podoviridae sp. ctrub15 TaxID=2826581 RepID=A0A8S5LUZ8_9CAUD|nr:MAG TPA: hypothetical protein [Podoviridae sp. ctrub15]
MRLLLVGSGGFDLGGPLVGFFCHAEQLFRNAVCKSRHRTGHGQSFLAVDGKVDDVVVNSVIANKAADVSNLRQCGRQIERFDFLREGFPFGFRSIHHAFNACPKHCAGGTWGQIDDALSLFEDLFGIFWHALSSRDTTSCGENKFASFKQNNLSTSPTHCNLVFARVEKSKGLFSGGFL